MCKNVIGGSQATDAENVERKLYQLSDKHAQRIERTTDDMDIKIKVSIQEMSSKYEMYSQSMTQQKQEIQELILTFQSEQNMPQRKVNSELKSQTEDVEKSLTEARQCQTNILDSQHTIMEMRNEVQEMLKEVKQQMRSGTYNMHSHDSQHIHDRSGANARQMEDL